MIAYKLLRLRRDGTLGPLFVGRSTVIPVAVRQYARYDLPHPGLAHRPGFHCTAIPFAPHIAMRLTNGEQRVWCAVDIYDYDTHRRPMSQGGIWYTAENMTVFEVLDNANVLTAIPVLFMGWYGKDEYKKWKDKIEQSLRVH